MAYLKEREKGRRGIEKTKIELERLKKEIKEGRLKDKKVISEKVGRIKERYGTGKYFKWEYKDEVFTYKFELGKIKEEARWDGYFVVQANEKELGVQESIKIYKNLKVTEEAFKVLKSSLEIRPIYHQGEEYIRGHIYICILALIIKQYLTFILKKHRIHTEVGAILKTLSTLNVGNIYLGEEKIGTKVGRFNEEQKKLFKIFKITHSEGQKIVGKEKEG